MILTQVDGNHVLGAVLSSGVRKRHLRRILVLFSSLPPPQLTWLRQDLVLSLQSEVTISGLGGLFASRFGRLAGTGFGFGSGHTCVRLLGGSLAAEGDFA